MKSAIRLKQSEAGQVLLLGGLCLIAYLPAFNNGFISDDFIILDRVDSVWLDPLFLFSIPPECFRFTSYICFGVLKFLFGFRAEWFYAFNLLLHFVNSILLWKLLKRVTQSDRVGYMAAGLFAVTQGHQEAIMWLAAMNETLLGLCLLTSLLCRQTERPRGGVIPYIAGLFSKESAVILPCLIPVLECRTQRRVRWRQGFPSVVAVTALFGILFLSVSARNFMLATGTYSLGFHAVVVFFVSLHRLMFPWVYLAIAIHLVRRVGLRVLTDAGRGLGFAAVALLPYVFLTYQNHVVSRQEYLPSVGIAWALAGLLCTWDSRTLRRGFVAAFVIANVGYIWIKDAQFEVRAAPTSRLIGTLRRYAPQDVGIIGFPANPWIARDAAKVVPGWKPDLIHVDEKAPDHGQWLTLEWDPKTNTYHEHPAQSPGVKVRHP